jgi:F-type H+-transporting ATPase subunit b
MRWITLLAAEDPTVTHHWLLPETPEIIYGGLASLIVVSAIAKFAGPAVRKSFKARTERIQLEIDGATAAKVQAEQDARGIRSALGDVASERSRMLQDSERQAEVLLAEGRARIAAEVADLEAKADADAAAARGRSADELRSQIARLAALATPIVVDATLTDATKKDLVESFISSVGAAR